MKFLGLILKGMRRSRRRTALTVLSVAVAVFLFASLRAVLQGFNAAAEASSSTRIVTIRSTSLIFSMPTSHAGAIRVTAGVRDLTWANWFGGIYKDPANFFAQFAIEPESYLRLYPEITLTPEERRAFLEDRTGCIVGERLARTYGWKVGDRIVLQVGIPVYGTQDFTFTIRGIYTVSGSSVDNQTMMFHWKYADERSLVAGQVGWFVAEIEDPDQAAPIALAIDRQFANTPNETKTDTERQFQSTFASMFGNLNLLLGSIAAAVVITTLFVAGNTMAMAVRERTTEFAVMRALGFPGSLLFMFVAVEGLLMALVGGLIGAAGAWALASRETIGLPTSFVPQFGVDASIAALSAALSVMIGLLAGFFPALAASRLKIVEALRRVA